MRIMDLNTRFLGNWQGTYRLVQSWLPNPDHICDSKMSITSVANGKFLAFTYDWQHEGITQEGLILIGSNNKKAEVTASWVDSWGMDAKIMNCYGTINDQGDIVVHGSYQVPENPDWGWRIEIPCPNDNTLQIIMYNLTPEGEASLAGDANYTRV
jgi:hypothetical protein